jgi:prepilin-type N-terminal cleavage/methylation domain-containing protein
MSTRDEGGFSLPELLVTITILGIVMTAVVSGFAMAVHVTDGADRRIASSADGQLLATWFTGDAQSAATTSTTTSACVAPGDTLVLGLQWTDVATDIEAAYVVQPGYGGRQLARNHCLEGSPMSSRVVFRFLDPTVNPTAVCTTECRLTVTDADGGTQRLTATRRALG